MASEVPRRGRREPLRAVIVGAGLMGRWHAHDLRRAGGRVIAIVDPDAAAARALARRHPGAATLQPDASWPSDEIDVTHVCTPVAQHASWVRRALERGSHVVVEKPLAASADEARQLLDLATELGRLVVSVHQFPFQAGVRRLLAERARLGELLGVTFRTHTAGADHLSTAERQRVLLEILPHPISLLYSLGEALPDPPEAPDWRILRADASALMLDARTADVDCRIEIDLDRRPTRNEWILDGTRGRGRADLYHGYGTVLAAAATRTQKILLPFREGLGTAMAAAANLTGRALRGQLAYPGLAELLGAVYRAIREDGPSPAPTQSVLAAAHLTDRVWSLVISSAARSGSMSATWS